jgi:Big-like domain-containing protein
VSDNGNLRKLLAASGLCLLVSSALPAQGPGRIATTPQALLASPAFFHGKRVAVYGQVVQAGEQSRLQVAVDEAAFGKRAIPQVFVFWKEQPSRSDGEIRGEFWDLGRINADDSRFSTYDFKRLLETVTNGRWPAREELFVIVGAVMLDSQLPANASLRAIAMAPDRYADREVTVVGRFRGRNLYADLPGPLNKSRWDFVLQSADAAIWTSGVQPRGKDFNLDPGARVDTGKWLRVNGLVRTEGNAVWIEAKSMELSTEPAEAAAEVELPPAPKAPPPEVVFSAPVPDEAAVERTTAVRIQFSWDMIGRSFRDRVRVTYVGPTQGGAPPEPPPFTVDYNEGNRALAIRFAKPLEPFQTLKVELLEGITAVDGQPLEPWALTFSTGG